jgi:hypothetical protein
MRSSFQAMAAVCCFLGCVFAEAPPKFVGRQVTIIKPQHTDDGFPKGPASVCLEGPPKRQCYAAPKDYGNNPTVTAVQLRKDLPALLFSAESGGVSGWSVHFALLGADMDDLLQAAVSVSNQNQHAFWKEPAISDEPIFLVADYAAGSDEAHYGPHRYIISAYFPNRSFDDGVYLLEDRYMTIRLYDLQSNADVLGSERPEVLSRLRRVKAAH